MLRGVCGEAYRDTIERSLGRHGYERAIRDSAFFFRDEVAAVLESQFGAAEAARITQPVLNVEGGNQPAHLRSLSREITDLTARLLPQAEIVIIPGVNHAMPLQNPDGVGAVIASFVRKHQVVHANIANRG